MAIKADSKKEFRVNIRKMTEGDIEGVLAVDRKITGQDRASTYATVPGSYVGGQLALSVVAEAEGLIVGFLMGEMVASPYLAADIALIQVIGVDPDYRRMHIGEKLTQSFLECCKEQGLESIHALVNVHDGWMQTFLQSLHFKQGEMVEFVKYPD